MRTRASIMESALDIFSEKNFANASVSEITARIGLSKGAFYWHFKNKQEILIKIIEEFCGTECNTALCMCEAEPNNEGSQRTYKKDMLARMYVEDRWQKLHKLMMRRHEWPEDIRERVLQILRDTTRKDIDRMEAFITARQKDGKVKQSAPAHKIAVLLISVFHGLCIAQISGTFPDELPECVDILFDAFVKEFGSGEA